MTKFQVELVGGPKATKGTIDVPGDEPPEEVPIKLEEGPPIRTEEGGPQPGVVTFAIYRYVKTDEDDGTAVYGFSHERRVG